MYVTVVVAGETVLTTSLFPCDTDPCMLFSGSGKFDRLIEADFFPARWQIETRTHGQRTGSGIVQLIDKMDRLSGFSIRLLRGDPVHYKFRCGGCYPDQHQKRK